MKFESCKCCEDSICESVLFIVDEDDDGDENDDDVIGAVVGGRDVVVDGNDVKDSVAFSFFTRGFSEKKEEIHHNISS